MRLFHWTLAALVGLSICTGLVGGWTLMEWHVWSGYGVLTLVVFRILWGFAGSTWSRFSSFVRPGAVLPYVRELLSGGKAETVGHSPLAGLSVLAMLLALLFQAGTGLFAKDAIFTEGPLARLVSDATSDLLTSAHHANARLLYLLIGLHLLAILAYELLKRERLVLPMLTGRKALPGADDARPWQEAGLALALLALCAAGVWLLVR